MERLLNLGRIRKRVVKIIIQLLYISRPLTRSQGASTKSSLALHRNGRKINTPVKFKSQ
jgi:hypothetical protein